MASRPAQRKPRAPEPSASGGHPLQAYDIEHHLMKSLKERELFIENKPIQSVDEEDGDEDEIQF